MIFKKYRHSISRSKKRQLPLGMLCFLLLFSCIFSLAFSHTAYAEGWPECTDLIEADGALLMDAKSSTILYAKNENTHYYPASITKVLTAIVVLEHVENLEEKVTFSQEATRGNLEANSTVIAASPGDKLSVRDCLYSLLLHSANDCANALAEHVAGSNEKFAELMNQKAQEIGCENSHFTNPSGLNNPEHYTSALDMAKIMQYAIKNPTFCQIDATQVYTHGPIIKYPDPNAPENTIYAHHKMMKKSSKEYYSGVFAGKTGYTLLAGNTLVTACKRGDTTLICVILNGHNSQYRDSKKLFDFGFSNFNSYPAEKNDPRFAQLENHWTVDGLPLVEGLHFTVGRDEQICLPKNIPLSDIASTLSYDITEEEKASGKVAKLLYEYDSKNVGTAYVYLEDGAKVQETENLPNTSLKKTENIPKQISVAMENQEKMESSEEDSPAVEKTNNAPIIFDKKAGKIILQKPIVRVLQILFAIAAIVVLSLLFLYLFQRREEFYRARRRKRMLKLTKDLSREQKTKRDLLLEKRKRQKK